MMIHVQGPATKTVVSNANRKRLRLHGNAGRSLLLSLIVSGDLLMSRNCPYLVQPVPYEGGWKGVKEVWEREAATGKKCPSAVAL